MLCLADKFVHPTLYCCSDPNNCRINIGERRGINSTFFYSAAPAVKKIYVFVIEFLP
jgi:hypothetical protein